MTPEEILNEFATTIVISPPMALRAKSKAIEAIKAYARKMCDKQKQECYENAEVETIDIHGQDCCYVDSKSILNAPYPKELL